MQIVEEQIASYIQGHLPENDRSLIENWVKQSPKNEAHFNQLAKILSSPNLRESRFEPNVELAWQKVSSRIEVKTAPTNYAFLYRVAAVIVFALGLGVLSYTYMKNDLTTITTKSGDHKELVLPDGTIIEMNEGSEIRFDNSFDEKKRIVHLKGQAFFQVARDVQRPFIVKGANSTIEVLGTSFDFLSTGKQAEVNVMSGEVAFYSNTNTENKATLVKGNSAELRPDGNLYTSSNLDTNTIAWRYGEMDFKSARLDDVIVILSKYYQVDFKLKENLSGCLITSSFADQNLEQALKTLEIIAGIKHKKRGKTILLSGPGC